MKTINKKRIGVEYLMIGIIGIMLLIPAKIFAPDGVESQMTSFTTPPNKTANVVKVVLLATVPKPKTPPYNEVPVS